jgi:hypothetical protein
MKCTNVSFYNTYCAVGNQNCVLCRKLNFSLPNCIGSKGERFDIKSPNQGRYQPMFCVFDILLLNDVVLSNKPLRERRKAVEGAFNPVEGRITLSDIRQGKTRCVLLILKLVQYCTVEQTFEYFVQT